MAMKMASVAPRTDRAPLIPQAHGNICGARALNSRTPVGIGIPNARPIGTSVATAMAIRVVRANGMAQLTNGVTTTITAMAIAATVTNAMAPVRPSDR